MSHHACQIQELRFRLLGFPNAQVHTPEMVAAAAEGSDYHLWWRCLRASPDYLARCSRYSPLPDDQDRSIEDNFFDFGNVRTSWASWWEGVGQWIFCEQADFPNVEVLSELEMDSPRFRIDPRSLYVKIPLVRRKQTILAQVNQLLSQHHDGRDLDLFEKSTAIVKLQSSNLQNKTLPLLVEVAEILFNEPDILIYDLAIKAELAAVHLGRGKQEELTESEEHQRREMAGSRYRTQARNLIYHAARGKFPCIDDPE